MESSSALDDQDDSDEKDLELLQTLGAATGQDLVDESSVAPLPAEDGEGSPPDISDDGRQVNVDLPNARRTLVEQALANRKLPFGQCFEHYYRTLLNEKNPARLSQLFNEPLQEVSQRSRNTDTEQAQVKLEKETGELISKLYYLAAKKWEKNPNVYLRVLDDFTKDKTCEHVYVLFSRTQEVFVQSFGDDRKERGESVELLDQIVKRTGEVTREQFARVLNALHVKEKAWELYTLWNSEDANRFEEIRNQILLYADQQVRELRIEFNSLPAQILAEQVHQILRSIDASDDLVDSIVAVEELLYLLRGRTKHDIELIAFQYNEKFHFGADELTLEEEMVELLTPEQWSVVQNCLQGFSAQRVADEIALLLNASGDHPAPMSYSLLPPVFSGQRAIRQEYENILPKRRMYRKQERATWERELLAQGAISSHLRGLCYEQFLEVNDLLCEQYGFELDYELYPQVRLFEPRSAVSRVRDLLAHARSLSDVFRAIEGYSPEEMRALREAWTLAEGTLLEEVLTGIVDYLFGKRVPEIVRACLSRRLQGVCRLPIEKDLLEFVNDSSLGKPIGAPIEDEEQTYCRDVLLRLAKFMQATGTAAAQKDSEVITLLSELPYETRTQLEWIFLSKTGQTLRSALQGAVSPEAFLEANLLLSGFNPRAAVKQMEREFDTFVLMRDRDFSCMAFINEFCRFADGKDFFSAVLSHDFGEETSIASRDYGLMMAHTPGAAVLREALFSGSTFECQVDDLLGALTDLGFEHIIAFERAYDRNFGSLRGDLKEALSENRLEKRMFARAILMLEGLPQSLVSTLEDLVGSGDVKQIQSIFLRYSSDIATLEECYNVVNPDAPLRLSIDACKASRGEINKTILYLDCYYPDEVASEVLHAIASGSSTESKVMEILADPLEESVQNDRLPSDLTWISEMYLQIRREYHLQSSRHLLEDAIRASFSGDAVSVLTRRLYGREIVEMANEIKTAKGQNVPFAKRLMEISRGKITRFLEGVVEYYDVHSRISGEATLQEELSAAAVEPAVAEELRKSFQSLLSI